MHIHTCIRMYMDKYTAFSNPAPTRTPALPKGQTHEGLWGDFHGQIFPRGPTPTFISQHTRPPREQKPLGNFCQMIPALALAWGPRAATRFPQGRDGGGAGHRSTERGTSPVPGTAGCPAFPELPPSPAAPHVPHGLPTRPRGTPAPAPPLPPQLRTV